MPLSAGMPAPRTQRSPDEPSPRCGFPGRIDGRPRGRARLGDEAAWRELVARYEGPLRRSIRGRLPRAARGLTDTDDMVQDATLNVLRRLPLIELRFPGRAPRLPAPLDPEPPGRRAPPRLADPHPVAAARRARHPGASPLDHTIDRDRRRRFRAGLSTLSPRDRRALVMRLEAGASYEAIATALGCPTPNAARVTVGRALHRMAEHMAAPAAGARRRRRAARSQPTPAACRDFRLLPASISRAPRPSGR